MRHDLSSEARTRTKRTLQAQQVEQLSSNVKQLEGLLEQMIRLQQQPQNQVVPSNFVPSSMPTTQMGPAPMQGFTQEQLQTLYLIQMLQQQQQMAAVPMRDPRMEQELMAKQQQMAQMETEMKELQRLCQTLLNQQQDQLVKDRMNTMMQKFETNPNGSTAYMDNRGVVTGRTLETMQPVYLNSATMSPSGMNPGAVVPVRFVSQPSPINTQPEWAR